MCTALRLHLRGLTRGAYAIIGQHEDPEVAPAEAVAAADHALMPHLVARDAAILSTWG